MELEIKDGEDTVTKEFVVVAYTDQPSSLGGGFMLPADTLQSFCKTRLTDEWNLTVYEDREGSVEEAVRAVADKQEFLAVDTYREQ